tara:strand:- start:5627 stop:5875 length:249 start_codon:yes stop_codon:yes gene_type:complete
MKSKFFKIVLPAFAILLAMSLSFATEANKVVDKDYYDHPISGATEVPIQLDCDTPVTATECTYLGFQVYDDIGLSIPEYKID